MGFIATKWDFDLEVGSGPGVRLSFKDTWNKISSTFTLHPHKIRLWHRAEMIPYSRYIICFTAKTFEFSFLLEAGCAILWNHSLISDRLLKTEWSCCSLQRGLVMWRFGPIKCWFSRWIFQQRKACPPWTSGPAAFRAPGCLWASSHYEASTLMRPTELGTQWTETFSPSRLLSHC